MSRQDRRNALIVAVIAAAGVITAAVINSGFWRKTPPAPAASEHKIENKAETKGGQSPAVVGAKDVTITYGEPAKGKPEKRK